MLSLGVIQIAEILPNKIDDDVGMAPDMDLAEGERSDITPDLKGIPEHLPHSLHVHLPWRP